jgi:hypothetical protein
MVNAVGTQIYVKGDTGTKITLCRAVNQKLTNPRKCVLVPEVTMRNASSINSKMNRVEGTQSQTDFTGMQ